MHYQEKQAIRGRGALENPKGRFERLEVACELQEEDAEPKQLKTELYYDASKSIIATNDSPDVGFSASVNPYRGCEHGCIYCFARPSHEYMGLSAGLDFETKLFVKTDAPVLLRKELSSKNWKPQVLGMSGVTDCYQPVERKFKLTRACLDVLLEFRNPVTLITKNHLIMRDIDILKQLAEYNAVSVNVSITTLDAKLARTLEPRASTPRLRLQAVKELAQAGIPVGVLMAPLIPGLTDSEIPAVLKAAKEAGATRAHYVMLRLPYGVKDLFETWLAEHYPLKKDKVLNLVRSMRGGKLYDPSFGKRMSGEGVYANQLEQMFNLHRTRLGLNQSRPPLSTVHFRRGGASQLDLF